MPTRSGICVCNYGFKVNVTELLSNILTVFGEGDVVKKL